MTDHPRPDPEISKLLTALEAYEGVPEVEQSSPELRDTPINPREDENRYAANVVSVMSKLLGRTAGI